MPDTDKAKWLARLKVGDLVGMRSAFSKVVSVRRIERFTETLIVTDDDRRFRQTTGHERGAPERRHWLVKPTAAQARKAKAGKAGR